MIMWVIILWTAMILFVFSLLYLGKRFPKFFNLQTTIHLGKIKLFFCSFCFVLGITGLLTFWLNFVNAVICIFYFSFFLIICDLIFFFIKKLFHLSFKKDYAGWISLVITILFFIAGWHLNHHVDQTNYILTTTKEIPDIKLAMFADSHIGTTFDAKGFGKHMKNIQDQNPDLVVIVGDYVDDETSRKDMVQASQILGKMKTKYGVYFVSGNHDKGYYGANHRGYSEQELLDELTKNGVIVLQDESVLIDNSFYLIGRRDFSEIQEHRGGRQSMEELIKGLDPSKYMIVLDHQPADYKNQEKSKVDLVLSGHTHCGQMFPFNQVGKWIGVNDSVYGHEKREKTDFIVTSGLSDWAIKFKTGTKSEYVIVDIKNKERKK